MWVMISEYDLSFGYEYKLFLKFYSGRFYRCWVTVKLFTTIVPLVAALLRVARVTAGLAESNGSLPPGL